MAWEWSHSDEGLANARAQLDVQGREWLETVWAEWQAYAEETRENACGNFDESKYTAALAKAVALPDDVLAKSIWDRMAEQATCDNGGWNAWACPYGCGCHTVPFSPVETAEA